MSTSQIEIAAMGHGFAGTPKCVTLNSSHGRYMFNCGEGSQRIGKEHGMINGTNRIFFTSGKWENVGGLMGMSLILEATNVNKLHLYGPPLLNHHIESSRFFSNFEKIEFVMEDMSKSFTDPSMTIDFIKIEKEQQSEYKARRYGLYENNNDAVAYLCKPHALPRDFDFEKCVELNIPEGPHLELLKEGKEVELSGRVIRPDDILSAKESNNPFLIVECPSMDHLYNFTSSPHFRELQGKGSQICLIVHFTESSIMANPLYVNWMKRFGPNTHHMVLNDLCSSIDGVTMHRIQTSRNLIHPIIFPLLHHTIHPESINTKDRIIITNEDTNMVRYAKTNTKYICCPFTKDPYDEEHCISLDPAKFLESALKTESIKTFVNKWQEKYQNLQRKETTPEDPEVVFLGTGSAIPSKYRNASGIMLNVGENASIMMDCGENTCGQFYRLYGLEEGKKKLKNLKAIFVSHLHVDHHMGLIGLAVERRKCFEEDAEPLFVIAPDALLKWFSTITCDNIPINELINFIPTECLYSVDQQKPKTYNKLLDKFDFEKIQTVRVQHTQFPHGVILKHKKGWKIVYSGDAMPSQSLIDAGQNCDLLLHEATFDANRVEEAKMRKHSTCDQAIEVGRLMKAKFIMLTHFSQIYRLPLFSEMMLSDDVGVAFDHMVVKLSDLHQLPSFVEAYRIIFEAEYEATLQVVENIRQHRLALAGSL